MDEGIRAMRITATIEDCEISIDDSNAPESSFPNRDARHKRIKELVKEVTESCIELHKQKISDELKSWRMSDENL